HQAGLAIQHGLRVEIRKHDEAGGCRNTLIPRRCGVVRPHGVGDRRTSSKHNQCGCSKSKHILKCLLHDVLSSPLLTRKVRDTASAAQPAPISFVVYRLDNSRCKTSWARSRTDSS